MWFTKKRFKRGAEAGKLSDGLHHSPGLELIYEHFAQDSPAAILDLGTSSKRNLDALSELTDDLLILGCFHAAHESGARGERFDFGDPESIDLPDRHEEFELILLWDLLHYWRRRKDAEAFAARVVDRLAPGGLILAQASAQVPIPPVPIQFKIAGRNKLDYELADNRVPSPALPMRAVEKMLAPCRPLRVFQLRNGLQEFVLRRPVKDG